MQATLQSPQIQMLQPQPPALPTPWTDVRDALIQFDALWDELFPAEQSRIIQLLVERVEIQPDRLSIKLCKDGLVSLANEIHQKAAA
jgi:hypothetical protein